MARQTCYMEEAGHLVLTLVILYTLIASWRSLNTDWGYGSKQTTKIKLSDRTGFYKKM
jgi:hypothetical protein